MVETINCSRRHADHDQPTSLGVAPKLILDCLIW